LAVSLALRKASIQSAFKTILHSKKDICYIKEHRSNPDGLVQPQDKIVDHFVLTIYPYSLDVSFREDESRIRKDNAPENFAVLRHIALNMIKKETSLRKSVKSKRLRAGWDTNYLMKILCG